MVHLIKSFDHSSPALSGPVSEFGMRYYLGNESLQVAWVKEGKIFGIRVFQVNQIESHEDLLAEIVSKEDFGEGELEDIVEVKAVPSFVLSPTEVIQGVPGNHFRRASGMDLPDAQIGDANPFGDVQIVYATGNPDEEGMPVVPVANQIVALGFAISKQRTGFTLVHLMDGYAWIGVWKDRKMMIFNRFPAASNEDLLYFVSLAMEQAKAKPSICPVLLSGELDKFSKEFKDIQAAMPGAVIPDSFFGSLFDKPDALVPTWKYGYLAF